MLYKKYKYNILKIKGLYIAKRFAGKLLWFANVI